MPSLQYDTFTIILAAYSNSYLFRDKINGPTHFFTVGEFGIVYKGQLKKGFSENYSEPVAVKTLKGIYGVQYISVKGPRFN